MGVFNLSSGPQERLKWRPEIQVRGSQMKREDLSDRGTHELQASLIKRAWCLLQAANVQKGRRDHVQGGGLSLSAVPEGKGIW